MSRYRGKDIHQSNESNAEDKLLAMIRPAYRDGRLREFPRHGVDAEFPILLVDEEGARTIVAKPDYRWDMASYIAQLDGEYHLGARAERRDTWMD